MSKSKYPWLVCAVCSLVILCSIGFTSTGFSIFIPYIKETTGLSNSATNLVVTVKQIIGTICVAILPNIKNKIGTKNCLALAVAANAMCFMCYAMAKTLFLYIIGGMFAGICYAFGGVVCISFMISKWFDSKRALATSICLAASGTASVFFAPILTDIVEKVSLKASFYTLAGFHLLICLLVIFIVKNDPTEIGLSPYQTCKEEKKTEKHFGLGITDKAYNKALIGLFFLGVTGATGSVFVASLFRTAGENPYKVAYYSSILGICIIIGKILYGSLAEKFGGYKMFFAFQTIYLIGGILYLFANYHNDVINVIGLVLSGLGISTTTIGLSLTASDYSSKENYEKRLSKMQFIYSIGTIASGLTGGVIADAFNSYVPVMFVNCICIATSGILMLIMYNKKVA